MEASRSDAADAYVWKEETRIADTQFELGAKQVKRNSSEDWDAIRKRAKVGELDEIPADIYVRCYNQLQRISKDHMVPKPRPGISVRVFWGVSGSGKTHAAIESLGADYYDKLPTTKFWDGYQGERRVLIDEFRGEIGVSHLLKWCDKYKCSVECKGGGMPLLADTIIITSNLHPRDWWKDLDE